MGVDLLIKKKGLFSYQIFIGKYDVCVSVNLSHSFGACMGTNMID